VTGAVQQAWGKVGRKAVVIATLRDGWAALEGIDTPNAALGGLSMLRGIVRRESDPRCQMHAGIA